MPQAFPYSFAGAGCTQEDIPGVEIVLTLRPWNGEGSPPNPYLRFEAAGLPTGSAGSFALSPLRRDPTQRSLIRGEFHDGGSIWLSGSIRIDHLIPGEPVTGEYNVCAGEGDCRSGEFRASWRGGTARCG